VRIKTRNQRISETTVLGRSVIFVQAAVPFYRQRLLELMDQHAAGGLLVYAGDEYFDPSIRTDVHITKPILPLRNRYLFRRRLLWQHGAVLPAVFADNVLLEFNPRILSVWITVGLRKILRRQTALFGHAWGRHGRGRSDKPRDILRRTAGRLVVYTESEAVELRAHDRQADVVAAGNAVYALSDAGAAPLRQDPTTFIYVGRLVQAKKPHLLLEAFVLARPRMPGARLLFVGEGAERPALERRVNEAKVSSAVSFAGHLDDVEALREAYADAVASVSPGYAGLSLTQSLWFGIPMLIARDEPHAPEIEAALEGETSYFCPSDSPPEMAAGLLRFWAEREAWSQRREDLARRCAERYSLDAMAARLIDAAYFTQSHKTTAEDGAL
jgi:glycosyltransferase involved in cell wall biosynthesis